MVNNYTPLPIPNQKAPQSQVIGKPKEAEPGGAFSDESRLSEVVELEPPPELKKVVATKPDTIKLSPDLKKLGLVPTSNSSFKNLKPIKLPLTDEKIVLGLNAPIISSLRWSAELCKYILSQSHLNLKKIHGHVIRVIKR